MAVNEGNETMINTYVAMLFAAYYCDAGIKAIDNACDGKPRHAIELSILKSNDCTLVIGKEPEACKFDNFIELSIDGKTIATIPVKDQDAARALLTAVLPPLSIGSYTQGWNDAVKAATEILDKADAK